MTSENDRELSRAVGRLEGRFDALEDHVSVIDGKIDGVTSQLTNDRLELAKYTAKLSILGWFGGVLIIAVFQWLTS